MLEEKLATLAGSADVIVLPEMFSTGFSMNSHSLSEPVDGTTVTSMKDWAKQYDLAICGSYIASENGQFFNRGFLPVLPSSGQELETVLKSYRRGLCPPFP